MSFFGVSQKLKKKQCLRIKIFIRSFFELKKSNQKNLLELSQKVFLIENFRFIGPKNTIVNYYELAKSSSPLKINVKK